MNLFTQLASEPTHQQIAPGAVLMRGLALDRDREFLAAVDAIVEANPLQQMITPSGLKMQVMGSDCGAVRGQNRWGGDAASRLRRWPPMPDLLHNFAIHAATLAGFPKFRPDACHINRYQAGTKLGLHQDRHECDWTQPIVSVSFGLECVFLFGGLERSDKPRHIMLEHGDVFVWGGPSRMCFHGVQPLKPGDHPQTGPYRINLTFRKVA